jgi:hypothetical protein
MVCCWCLAVSPDEPVGTDAHLFDILADGAALVAHVLPDVVGCAHWFAHDAEAVYLYYIEVWGKHGAEDLDVYTKE